MNPQELPLRDLHLPPMTGWWPLAPGWWVLAAVILIVLVLTLRRMYRHWRSNRPRRIALKRLAAIRREFQRGANAITLARELSQLTRRAMLAYAPRNDVAGVSGDKWLEWLDRGLEEKPFGSGAGRVLICLPYMSEQQIDNDTDVLGLIDAVHRRLKKRPPRVNI